MGAFVCFIFASPFVITEVTSIVNKVKHVGAHFRVRYCAQISHVRRNTQVESV